jgi:hypothetical protein
MTWQMMVHVPDSPTAKGVDLPDRFAYSSCLAANEQLTRGFLERSLNMRQGTFVAWITICVIVLSICGCGKKDDSPKPSQPQGSTAPQGAAAPAKSQAPTQAQAPAQPPAAATAREGSAPGTPTDMAKLAEQQRQALTQANGGKQITAVTGDTLKALLPETLAGMKRTKASAEKNQMMGIDMSKAEGDYEGQESASINLVITDVGNMSGPMKMGMTAWTMAQYNRETDTGYEKTATYGGYKGMEEYNKQNKDGTIRVFVADRFIVELNGNNVTMDTLKQALDQVDLKKVAAAVSGS